MKPKKASRRKPTRGQDEWQCEPQLSEAKLLDHLRAQMHTALCDNNLEAVRLYAGRLVSLMNEYTGWRKPP